DGLRVWPRARLLPARPWGVGGRRSHLAGRRGSYAAHLRTAPQPHRGAPFRRLRPQGHVAALRKDQPCIGGLGPVAAGGVDVVSGVAIIGGGFAGLAAGVALAARGVPTTLLESRPRLGGRAYSFTDETTGEIVDNGQHAMMGCYTHTLAFLEQ